MKKIDFKNTWKNRWIKQEIIDLIILKNLKISKKELFFLENITDDFIKKIEQDLEKVQIWEPIEYILGKAEFFGLEFFVDSRVLIPRNDTEVMVQKVLEIKNLKKFELIDIWTGSWAIICAIFKNSEIKKWFALDISEKALEVAKINILNLELKNKINICKSNLLEIFFDEKKDFSLKERLIITANLPYVKNWDFENMSTEVLKYEPKIALFWWQNTGFELYEKLIRQCLQLKEKYNLESIFLFIEIWFDQEEIAKDFLKIEKLNYSFYKDNSWIQRCIQIEI